ncbi:L-lactate dehydrogenase [Mesomycoplasma lagogenitalium]|uniref:L-lactate dehydrogenase n=1 Tax=Mesomycoplasma lagogenitalium TaxID=171286 RepID=A0ABY8LU82_9BACT|nr:L-lactate dehydrogenase [Mesomycoplasma lagogenitalium]WGI36797.1 L-lactate dehydrogenase [Mesomycoplasma lagogenitalium]
MKETKIILIGCGAVGTSFLYSAINQGLASEYGLIDKFEGPRDGNVLDLEDAISPSPRKYNIYATDYSNIKDADILVITAGRPQAPGETRLEMVKDNSLIMKEIARNVKESGFNGITIIASNPVDVLTYVYLKETGFDSNKVIGSGTSLDTARLKRLLSLKTGVSTDNINAYVLGEHGDSSLVNYSSFKIGTLPFSKYEEKTGINPSNYEELLEKPVYQKAYRIIERKRATFYGIGACLAEIVRNIQEDSNKILAVGAYLENQYEVNDVVTGVPAIIGKDGIKEIVELELNEKELNKFKKSVKIVKDTINSIK